METGAHQQFVLFTTQSFRRHRSYPLSLANSTLTPCPSFLEVKSFSKRLHPQVHPEDVAITTRSICAPSCGQVPPLPSPGTLAFPSLLRICIQTHLARSCPTAIASHHGLLRLVSLSLQDYSFSRAILKTSQSCPRVSRGPGSIPGANNSQYCPSTSSMGCCLPPPSSSQSISTTVFPKDYISGKERVERDTCRTCSSQP